ncbi:hypothetical protein BH11PSE10_BH11PSE10_05290 [soil metagenome]
MNPPEATAPPLLCGFGAAWPGSEQLPLGMLLLDTRSGAVLQLNQEAERLLGLKRASLLNRPAAECFPAELARICTPARWAALAGSSSRSPTRQTLALATRHGQRWLKVQMSRLPPRDGAAPTGMLTLLDASAERQLERALRESDLRFREVTEAVSECLFVTTPQWDRLHFSSPLLLDMLGLTVLELRRGARALRERIHPLDLAVYDRRLLGQAQGSSQDLLLRINHPGKGLRWLRLRSRLQMQDGQTLVYVVLADVSDEQQRQQELHAARHRAEAGSRAKSEFMANMSHEFRTPMNGVLGMTELLLNSELSPAQRRHAELARHSAEGLLRLLDDVLDFARVDADGQPLAEQVFAPVALAERALAGLRPQAEAKGLSLLLAAAPELPPQLLGDGERIAQVLARLLDNALKFTERGGALLRLSTRQDPVSRQLWLEFEVSDSGIGLDPADLPRLTKAFNQGNASLARLHNGTGLGLAIAQQLLAGMGGSLAVQPSSEGGSTFSFAVRVQTAPSTTGFSAEHPVQGRYILVVEDNPVNQEVTAQMLAHLGCRVRVADDGASGLAALQEERFDLVMMDIHMPGMDGMEALKRFRRAGQGQSTGQTPVVAVTANALSGDEQNLLRHGFDDYLPKPFRQSQLLAMLMRRLPNSEPGTAATAAVSAAASSTALPTPQPGTAMSADPKLLDAQALARLHELDPSGANQLLERVISAYMKSLERLLPDLAAARGPVLDLAVVRHVSHTLKSSSASLGALALAQRCAEIETLARNGHADGIDLLLDNMLVDIEKVRSALLALLNEGN